MESITFVVVCCMGIFIINLIFSLSDEGKFLRNKVPPWIVWLTYIVPVYFIGALFICIVFLGLILMPIWIPVMLWHIVAWILESFFK